MAVLSAVAAALLAMPGSVAAGDVTWSTQTLRNAPHITFEDAAFGGPRVAVAWREEQALFVRRSTDSGESFEPAELVVTRARQARGDYCASGTYFLAIVRTSGDTTRIVIDQRTAGTPGSVRRSIASRGDGRTRDPDIACAAGRVFVAWQQRIAGRFHIMVSNARRSDLAFGATPLDLGGSTWPTGGTLAAAASGHWAFVAHARSSLTDNGPVKVTRFHVGGAPGFAVISTDTRQIAPKGSYPQIAAAGQKVVVAWSSPCGALKARVSHDHGSTWGPTRTLVSQPCDVVDVGSKLPDSIGIGPTDFVSYIDDCGGLKSPPCENHRQVSSGNDFATKDDRRLIHLEGYANFETGFVTLGGHAIVAMAHDAAGHLVRFRREH